MAIKPIIYDNGGKTIDRYTIFIGNQVYGMSENPLSPQGFNQFVGLKKEISKTLLKKDKKVKFSSLPEEVKKAINYKLKQW